MTNTMWNLMREPRSDIGNCFKRIAQKRVKQLKADKIPPFRYRELPKGWTRVVSLAPGRESDLLLFMIIQGPIDDDNRSSPIVGKYGALSYVWGNNGSTVPVVVEDMIPQGTPGVVYITESLATALRVIRLRDRLKVLWLDQICIDQANLAEKEQQIEFMRTIYERASHVIAWLGPAANDSDMVFDAIASIRLLQKNNQSVPLTRNEVTPTDGITAFLDDLPCSVASLCAFFDRPYWKRVWALQEGTSLVMKDIEVRCGCKVIDLDWISKSSKFSIELSRNLHRLDAQAEKFLVSLRPITVFQEFASKREKAQGQWLCAFRELMAKIQQLDTTDPRDKVFVMLNFASENTTQPRFLPDYSKSTETIFIDTALWHMSKSRTLDVLDSALCEVGPTMLQPSKCGRIMSSIGSLSDADVTRSVPAGLPEHIVPSWTPNWSDHCNTPPIRKFANLDDPNSKPHFRASGRYINDIRVEYPTECEVNSLLVTGLRIGTITKTLPPRSPGMTVPEFASTWLNCCDTSKPYSLTAEPARDVMKRTLAMDTRTLMRWDEGPEMIRRFTADDLSSMDEPEADAPMNVGDPLYWYPELTRSTHDRIPFSTSRTSIFNDETALIGSAGFWSEPGDEIWILKGGKVPYVLRPLIRPAFDPALGLLDLNNGQIVTLIPSRNIMVHSLVSECFIHGLMDGQAVDMLETLLPQDYPLPLKDMTPRWTSTVLV